MPIILASSGAAQSEVYPASVITKGLQAVYDLRIGGTATPGIRSATTSTLGVTTLPANCTYSGGYLIITGNTSFSNWNFNVVSNLGVVVRGSTTAVTFTDCAFGVSGAPPTPSVNDTRFYGLQISDNGTAPTVTCSYCTFDGGKYDSNVGVSGPWSGAAVYVLTGATLTCDHCRFWGCGYDVAKVTNAFYNQTWCLIQSAAWNANSDADLVQGISADFTVDHCLFDISDGSFAAVGQIPGYYNQAIFTTIDTPSTRNSTPTVTSNIFKGWSGFGTGHGSPYTVVSVADNHTGIGTGFHVVNGVWTNNVIEPGNSGASGYWTYGGTETSAGSIASWTGNIDYATGSTIAAPSFG